MFERALSEARHVRKCRRGDFEGVMLVGSIMKKIGFRMDDLPQIIDKRIHFRIVKSAVRQNSYIILRTAFLKAPRDKMIGHSPLSIVGAAIMGASASSS